MLIRPFWIRKVTQAWKKRSLVWLSGVRRAGKTTLAKMLEKTMYLNCDLPSVTRMLADPEAFYDSLDKNAVVIFDEVHRVDDPSLLLKIAVDEYPHLKILATGSSTLAATRKFRDSLTGRKYTIYLPPVLWSESRAVFGIKKLDRRFLHGGLPESLLANEINPSFFAEWMDSFYARDIQELFGVRNRTGFLKLMHLLFRQSAGLVDYSNLARMSGLSRPTVMAHIEAMQVTHAIFMLPPFHGGGRREITSRPKCYAFDTGLIAFVNGWESMRESDRGLLWEHLVLDTLRTHFSEMNLFYWRDKSGQEIDFVVKERGREIHTIECKIKHEFFRPKSLYAFRALYPHGKNYVLCPSMKRAFNQRFKDMLVTFCSLENLPILKSDAP